MAAATYTVQQLGGEALELEVEPPADGAVTGAVLREALARRLGIHRFEVSLCREEAPIELKAPVEPGAQLTLVKQPFLPQSVIDKLVEGLKSKGIVCGPGLSDEEIATAEANCGIRFPEDLRAFLQTTLPDEFFDYRNTFPGQNLNASFDEGVLFDVKENDTWLDDWGERPEATEKCLELARQKLKEAPRLIPIYAHRCMSSVDKAGQPVLSIHQTDIIVYGSDLASYLAAEFKFEPVREVLAYAEVLHIPVWSDFM